MQVSLFPFDYLEEQESLKLVFLVLLQYDDPLPLCTVPCR